MQATALVFMVTFVSSLFIQTEYNYVILQPNRPLCYYVIEQRLRRRSSWISFSTHRRWLTSIICTVVIALDEYCTLFYFTFPFSLLGSIEMQNARSSDLFGIVDD